MIAAALALALSAAARAEPPDDWARYYSKDYDRAVLALLARLPSTRAHAAFLLEERLDLVVTDSIDRVDDDVLGCYDLASRRLFVDKVRLLNGADELEDGGAPRGGVGEILAYKTLPTIVHETRHAMTHRALQKEFGAWLALPYVESEQLSFYDEVLALRDMFRERPKLWSPGKILSIEKDEADVLRIFERGPDQLDALVRRLYAASSSVLADPRDKLLDKALRRERGFTAAGNERAAGLYRATARVLEDDASFARLQSFFRDGLAAKRALLVEIREDRKR